MADLGGNLTFLNRVSTGPRARGGWAKVGVWKSVAKTKWPSPDTEPPQQLAAALLEASLAFRVFSA